MALIAGLWVLATPSALADHGPVHGERIDGANRYDTAANVALQTFDSADQALVATGKDYPDALAASYAAGVADAPILLTGSDQVPDVTRDALATLDVSRVVLIGGDNAVHPDVEVELDGEGYDVVRVAGTDRYDTANMVAGGWSDEGPVGTLDGDRTALLASGEGFADAVAAGPVAAGANFPLLLTTSEHSQATRLAASKMDELAIDRVIVVGGPKAVSDDVIDHLREEGHDGARGFEVERWHGTTRAGTAAMVADNAEQRLGFSPDVTLLARGDSFADALTAGVQGGMDTSPVLLAADAHRLSAESHRWLADACPETGVVRAIGGQEAISDGTLADGVDAAEGCHDDPDHDEFSRQPRSSEGFPSGGLAQLTDARAGDHDDFDRFVLELPGEPIGWQVEWVDDPRHPSGEPVDVRGDAHLTVHVTATANWGDGDYDGPDRVAIDGDVATEAVLTEDFEGMLTWVVGLQREAPFAVDVLDDPQRFVLDVTDH